MPTFSGSCLCRAVTYQGKAELGGGHCHCTACRKSSGTSHCSHMIVTESDFRLTGELRFYDSAADSGNLVSRGFCPNCGSAIYSKNSSMPGMVFVRASSLDTPEVFQPQMVVYAANAVSWSQINADLPHFDSMPSAEDIAAMMA
ncbi:MAG: GFA family protein [Motiliproteus sp.]